MKQIVYKPDILLPRTDLRKWSVVACDQFTSDRNYWDTLDGFVGDAPSALRLILPECYLEDEDVAARQAAVRDAMRAYLHDGLFCAFSAFVEVRRTFASGRMRKGLVAAIDLEAYDYRPQMHALVRATEGTVESRLPPRVAIRSQSALELPHIMLLLDDPENLVFSAVEKSVGDTLYDFPLNCGGGNIVGRAVTDEATIAAAFETLGKRMCERFGEELLLLVGDGNHSLAAAKACYEQAKAAGDETAERKRYALCEIVNLYDEGIVFEPIHRAVFGVNPAHLAEALNARADGGVPATVRGGGVSYAVSLPQDTIASIAFVQDFLEAYVAEHGGRIDYIHGDDVLRRLGDAPDCATIAFAPIGKSGFTEYIVRHGVLPKKTFSMGHAEEKRYYLEARRIGE